MNVIEENVLYTKRSIKSFLVCIQVDVVFSRGWSLFIEMDSSLGSPKISEVVKETLFGLLDKLLKCNH